MSDKDSVIDTRSKRIVKGCLDGPIEVMSTGYWPGIAPVTTIWHPPMVLYPDGTTDYPHGAVGQAYPHAAVDQAASSDLMGAAQDKYAAHHGSDKYVSPTGAVRNSVGKTRFSLIPMDTLEGAARVFEMGAKKYSAWNWRKGFPPEQCLDSVFRHLSSLQSAIETGDRDGNLGHLLDAESKEAHVHHLICSVLILADSLKKDGFKI